MVTISVDTLNRASDGAFAINERQQIVMWNKAAEGLLGYQAAEVVGQYCFEVIDAIGLDGEPVCGSECAAMACFNQGQAFGNEDLICRTRDGHSVLLNFGSILLPQHTENGASKAIVLIRRIEPSHQEWPLNSSWSFRCLGPFRVYRNYGRTPINNWRRRQSLTLLKYLLTYRGRPIHREVLIDTLWPGLLAENGLPRLKVVMCSLRHTLEPDLEFARTSSFILREGDCYLFNAESKPWIDVDRFEHSVKRGQRFARDGDKERALVEYRKAETLYTGDYLEEDLYEDWCAEEREWLKELYLTLLTKMTVLYIEEGEYERGLECCRKALPRDPLREHIHRMTMKGLWLSGRRGEALRQYLLCRETLHRELGVPPLPETVELYERILEG